MAESRETKHSFSAAWYKRFKIHVCFFFCFFFLQPGFLWAAPRVDFTRRSHILISGSLLTALCSRTRRISVQEWAAAVCVQLAHVTHSAAPALTLCLLLCLVFFVIQKEWQHWTLFKKAQPSKQLLLLYIVHVSVRATDTAAYIFICFFLVLFLWISCGLLETLIFFFLFLDIPWHYLCIPSLQHKRSVVGLLREYMHILCQGLGWPWNKYFCSELFGVAPCEPLKLMCLEVTVLIFYFFFNIF